LFVIVVVGKTLGRFLDLILTARLSTYPAVPITQEEEEEEETT
jgi:hypothetical protein